MGTDPRHNGHDLTRLTISGGKHTEPRLMMAHPSRWLQVRNWLTWRASPSPANPPRWQLIAMLLVTVVIIALVGSSR
jgi:hypothetical protein